LKKQKVYGLILKVEKALVKLEVEPVDEKGFCKALFYKEDFSSQRYFYLEEGYEKYKENLTLNFKKINWEINASTIKLVFNKTRKEAYLTFIIENFSKEENDSYIIKLHYFKGWFWNQTGNTFNFYNSEDDVKVFGPSSLNILVIKLPETVNASFNQQKFEIKYLKQKINLKLDVEVEKTQFIVGEEISFKLKVTNIAQQRLIYKRNSVTFKIIDSKGQIVYFNSASSKDVYDTIEPKQTLIYEFTWNQICNNGKQASPGLYKLVGSIEDLNAEKEIQLNAPLIPGFELPSILLGLILGAFMILTLKKMKFFINP
jgi:hypothetical protein